MKRNSGKEIELKVEQGAIFDYIKMSPATAPYEALGHVTSCSFMQTVQLSSLIYISPGI
jgi:hypothetical protein